MGQDEDAEMARGLDEPGGRDRLAGRRRVAEAESADRAGVVAGELELEQLVVDEAGVEVVVGVFVGVDLGGCAVGGACPFPLPFSSAGRWVAAMSSASMPASASTWWRRSSVPAAVRAGSSVSTRSSPSMSP